VVQVHTVLVQSPPLPFTCLPHQSHRVLVVTESIVELRLAAATPGADMESNRAWIRAHIADGAMAATRDGIVTLVFDPRKGSLEIEGGL
jgi:hypothetical protein